MGGVGDRGGVSGGECCREVSVFRLGFCLSGAAYFCLSNSRTLDHTFLFWRMKLSELSIRKRKGKKSKRFQK